MKAVWIALLQAVSATTGSGAEKLEPQIVVYFHHGSENAAIVGSAEQQAQHMLASVGISMAWRLGTPNYHGRAELVEAVLLDDAPATFRPGSLAFATLGVQSGTRTKSFTAAYELPARRLPCRRYWLMFWFTRSRTSWKVWSATPKAA